MSKPTPKRQPSTIETVLIILFIEATIIWGFFVFRGLATAIREAAQRYEMNGNYQARKEQQSEQTKIL